MFSAVSQLPIKVLVRFFLFSVDDTVDQFVFRAQKEELICSIISSGHVCQGPSTHDGLNLLVCEEAHRKELPGIRNRDGSHPQQEYSRSVCGYDVW